MAFFWILVDGLLVCWRRVEFGISASISKRTLFFVSTIQGPGETRRNRSWNSPTRHRRYSKVRKITFRSRRTSHSHSMRIVPSCSFVRMARTIFTTKSCLEVVLRLRGRERQTLPCEYRRSRRGTGKLGGGKRRILRQDGSQQKGNPPKFLVAN